jgi:hypothetical protein
MRATKADRRFKFLFPDIGPANVRRAPKTFRVLHCPARLPQANPALEASKRA